MSRSAGGGILAIAALGLMVGLAGAFSSKKSSGNGGTPAPAQGSPKQSGNTTPDSGGTTGTTGFPDTAPYQVTETAVKSDGTVLDVPVTVQNQGGVQYKSSVITGTGPTVSETVVGQSTGQDFGYDVGGSSVVSADWSPSSEGFYWY
jgi:hypothetical protein